MLLVITMSLITSVSTAFADAVDEKIDFLFANGFQYFFVDRGTSETKVMAFSEQGAKVDILMRNEDGKVLRQIYEQMDSENVASALQAFSADAPASKKGGVGFDLSRLFNRQDSTAVSGASSRIISGSPLGTTSGAATDDDNGDNDHNDSRDDDRSDNDDNDSDDDRNDDRSDNDDNDSDDDDRD